MWMDQLQSLEASNFRLKKSNWPEYLILSYLYLLWCVSLSQIDSNVRSMGIVSQQFSQSCIHCTKNDSMQGCANWFGGFNDGLIYIIYSTFPLQTKKRRIWSTIMTWPFEYVIFKSWSQDEPFWFPVTFKHFWGVRQLAPPTIRLCNYE
jgi:hypothetical protein